jgi:murein L,D-transpeptidase YcbB/YkuD
MRIMRSASALLILLAALGASPAAAYVATDGDGVAVAAKPSSPYSEALRAALKTFADTSDPVENAVLAGVRAFYESRNFELLWLNERTVTPRMMALRRRMDAADTFGLDPALYQTPKLARFFLDDPALLARADIEFSQAVARFVTHIASGRLPPSDVSRLITLDPERPDIGKALSELSSGQERIFIALARYEPAHPQYRALKAALAELRASTDDEDRIVVPDGVLLKPGMSDDRVPLLRQRFKMKLAADAGLTTYDDALVQAVEAFQTDNGLKVDGIVGPATLALMNGASREDDIAAVVANLERWRWMPRDLGAFHVFVNVPEYMVRVFRDGEAVHETRVIVGKPNNPTPMFSHVMDHLVVNPYWNVPYSIIKNEMMADLRRNPYGFSRGGYQVFARIGGRYRRIDPALVAWAGISPRLLQIRQVPGDRNALGRIKFMFPNQHSVYLHDTPSKKLFQRDHRALSHGCVRVQNPLEFADAILPVAAPEWNSARIEKLYGGKERRINLDTPIPVHLAYFTIAVDADGTLRRFADIYGYDSKIASAPQS